MRSITTKQNTRWRNTQGQIRASARDITLDRRFYIKGSKGMHKQESPHSREKASKLQNGFKASRIPGAQFWRERGGKFKGRIEAPSRPVFFLVSFARLGAQSKGLKQRVSNSFTPLRILSILHSFRLVRRGVTLHSPPSLQALMYIMSCPLLVLVNYSISSLTRSGSLYGWVHIALLLRYLSFEGTPSMKHAALGN